MHALGSFDRTVHFAFDSAELTADARNELHEVAKCLTNPRTINLNIIINGHTDAVGSDEYNQGLSERGLKHRATLGHRLRDSLRQISVWL